MNEEPKLNTKKPSPTKIFDIGRVPYYKDMPDRFMFPYSQMNWLLNGGVFDRVTLITSKTDQGKTTLTSDIVKSIIAQDFKCCCFFGEDSAREARDRLFLQSTKNENNNIVYKPFKVNGKNTNTGEYFLSDKAFEAAQGLFAGKLYLYNELAGYDVDTLLDGFDTAIKEFGCKVFVVDNVEQFDFASENENQAVKSIIIKIRDFAKQRKVHIFLIAHIKKTERDVILPTLDDVKGTSAIANIAKNVIIVLRMDKVDKSTKQYTALKRLVALSNYNLDEADCLCFCAKTKGNRIGYVCLKYNFITKSYYECKKIDDKKDESTPPPTVVQQNTIFENAKDPEDLDY